MSKWRRQGCRAGGNLRARRREIKPFSSSCEMWNHWQIRWRTVCFIETLLQEDILDFSVQISDNIRKPDSGKGKGGGIAALVSNRLHKVSVKDPPQIFQCFDESVHLCNLLWLHVRSLAKLLPGYVPPNGDPGHTFNFPTACQSITHPCKDLLLHL